MRHNLALHPAPHADAHAPRKGESKGAFVGIIAPSNYYRPRREVAQPSFVEIRPLKPPQDSILGALALLGFALVSGCDLQPAFGCPYDALITQEAQLVGVPPQVALTICHAESSGNPGATGPGEEVGLFQVSHALSHDYVLHETENLYHPDLKDPATNIRIGLWHLSKMRKIRDPRNYLSWHNAGVQDWRLLKRQWSLDHPNRLYRAAYRTWRATP